MKNEICHLDLENIIPNRYQIHELLNDESLNDLVLSIKQHGVIQPIVVRKFNDKYEIIDGYRRYKGAILAGLTKIPALIKTYTDKETKEEVLFDNLKRTNLNILEEAQLYRDLLKNKQMTQESLATMLGKSQSAIANRIRLLSLPIEIKDALLNNDITERHARSLLVVKDTKQQLELLTKIKKENMTIRELDSEIKNMSNKFIPEEFSNNMSNSNIQNETDTSMPNFDNMALNNNENNSNDFQQENNFINSPVNQGFDNNQNNVNQDNQNPFLTSENYVPPMSTVNNENFNPFSNIRLNTQKNMPNANYVMEDENNNANSSLNSNESPDFTNLTVNSNDLSSSESNSNFDINDYKLPGVDYSNNNQINESTLANNSNSSPTLDNSSSVDSLDDVINILKDTLNRLKGGKVNVETDEIDYDDVYQITIKVSKKNNF